jgi:Flp pilus assembly protein TadD
MVTILDDRLRPERAEVLTELGIALAAQGRLDEAEERFRQVAELRPDDPEPHNHLGAVLAALERWDEAIAHYQRAIERRPVFSAVYGNLAEALRGAARFEEALEIYRRALQLQGETAELHYGLGCTLRSLARHAQAVIHFRRALEIRPDTIEVQTCLATTLLAAGRHAEALAAARQVRRTESIPAGVSFDLGTTLLKLRHFEEAARWYRQALRLRPDDPDTLNNLGTALWEQGDPEHAEVCYRKALRLRPGDPDVLNNLGTTLREQVCLDEALGYYREALQVRKSAPETLMNLGVVLSDLEQQDAAEDCIRQALGLRSDWATAHDNLGTVLLRQGRQDEALACHEQALELEPEHAEAHRNRAMAWLASGDFARGWPEYEWRLWCRGRAPRGFCQPRWDGDGLAGRTILLHAEQGLGDTLQFIRYAPLVKQRGGRVVVVCPQPLVPIVTTCRGIDQVVPEGSTLPAFDVHAPLLSLPMILGTTLVTIPVEVPYLWAVARAIDEWRRVLDAGAAFRVGIAWQGNPRQRSDRRRSFPLARLAPLAQVEGVRLICLQRGAGTEQLAVPDGQFPVTVLRGWEEKAGDLAETAAIMKSLDLVVTPCTALAHLAGALGVHVWVALSRVADWRWLTGLDTSPWYPTMRLFRQTQAGQWDDVFARMADDLNREAAARAGTC